MSENWAKRTKVAGWHPTGRRTAHFSWVLVRVRRRAAKSLVAIEAIVVYLFSAGRPKRKSRCNQVCGNSSPETGRYHSRRLS